MSKLYLKILTKNSIQNVFDKFKKHNHAERDLLTRMQKTSEEKKFKGN